MTPHIPRESNGQFAEKGYAESGTVTLTASEPTKFPDLDEAKNKLIAGGADEPQARALVAGMLAHTLCSQLRDSAKNALDRGNETGSAMALFAHNSLYDVIEPLTKAHEDPEAAQKAIERGRRSLDNYNGLFGGMGRNGTVAVFDTSKQMLQDVQDYLAEGHSE